MKNKTSFLSGASILAASIAATKVIGALYKIPLGNILDDPGFGYFNIAYSIYNLLLMVSTAGLPIAMSKTISEAYALGRSRQVKRIFYVSLCTFLILGAVSSLVMLFFSESLSILQGNVLAAPSMKALSISCFCVCTISAFRGYAQGHSNMVPTSVSQVIEATVKLITGLCLAWYLLHTNHSSEYVAAGAISGVSLGSIAALIFLVVQFKLTKPSLKYPDSTEDYFSVDSVKQILKSLAAIAIPITLSASIVPITTYLDTIQVQNLLHDSLGYTKTNATGLYGCYQKAVTIFNLPSAFMVAITASIIPAVSGCLSISNHKKASHIVDIAMRIGMILALPAGAGLSVLSKPIIQLLFHDTNQEIGAACLQTLGIASIFVCTQLLTSSILQAYGRILLPVSFIFVGSVCKLTINYFLVQRPEIGVMGAPIGTLACFFLISILQVATIKKIIHKEFSLYRIFLKPAAASVIMGVAVWITNRVINPVVGNALSVFVSIVVGVVVYSVLIMWIGVVTPEDFQYMPGWLAFEKLRKLFYR